MQTLGFHTLIELHGCDAKKINDTALVEKTLLEAAKIASLSVVNTTIHHFNPIGVSGVIVIKESHIAIHTWPEYKYVALDFFTCNESYELTEALAYIKTIFEAEIMELKEVKRGTINQLTPSFNK
ncbi:MAG: adenosylmethionine decarboxylase [Flavobacteriales bacterium]|jgi:S-adenosylmethionine decarboxylase proenzyme|nr:adenosylmethionine decarboxylase [Flavobacteriales bacterium]